MKIHEIIRIINEKYFPAIMGLMKKTIILINNLINENNNKPVGLCLYLFTLTFAVRVDIS